MNYSTFACIRNWNPNNNRNNVMPNRPQNFRLTASRIAWALCGMLLSETSQQPTDQLLQRKYVQNEVRKNKSAYPCDQFHKRSVPSPLLFKTIKKPLSVLWLQGVKWGRKKDYRLLRGTNSLLFSPI